MKGLFWFGLVVLVLGVASIFVPIPRSEREGIRAGNVDIGVQVKHKERVSPIITAVLVIGGAGMMIAGGRGQASDKGARERASAAESDMEENDEQSKRGLGPRCEECEQLEKELIAARERDRREESRGKIRKACSPCT